jgi:hypothetical protein
VSERAIRAAQAVCRAPTALEAVTSGLVPKIGTAAKIAALPEPQQQEVTRLIRTGEARSPVAAITQVTREATALEAVERRWDGRSPAGAQVSQPLSLFPAGSLTKLT